LSFHIAIDYLPLSCCSHNWFSTTAL